MRWRPDEPASFLTHMSISVLSFLKDSRNSEFFHFDSLAASAAAVFGICGLVAMVDDPRHTSNRLPSMQGAAPPPNADCLWRIYATITELWRKVLGTRS